MSARPAPRRSATNRNTSLPTSAQECAASAVIDADPVRAAATDLPSATTRLAKNASTTVRETFAMRQ